MIVGILNVTTGTIITIGTTTGIATVATSTSMTTTSEESEWDGLISLNFETNALALCRSRGAAKKFPYRMISRILWVLGTSAARLGICR